MLPSSVPPTSTSKGSTLASFFNFFKQLFGAGLLALPHAFLWSGLTGGIICYVLVLGLCCYSQQLLVQCLLEAKARQRQSLVVISPPNVRESLTQPLTTTKSSARDTSTTINLNSYTNLVQYVTNSRAAAAATGILVCVLELCFCVGWVIVVVQNLQIVFGPGEFALGQYFPELAAWSRHIWTLGIVFPVIAALCCIPYMTQLWPLSFFGLVIYLVGIIGFLLVHMAVDGRWQPPSNSTNVSSTLFLTQVDMETTPSGSGPPLPNFFSGIKWSTLTKFIGVAAYSLESVLMVIPTVESMRHPEHSEIVITSGIVLCAFVVLSFAAPAYVLGYGDCGTQGTMVTDCLPASIMATVVRGSLAVTLSVGYPVLLFPVSTTLEGWLGFVKKSSSSSSSSSSNNNNNNNNNNNSSSSSSSSCRCSPLRVKQITLRVVVVLGTCVVATAVNNFAKFSSLVGALLVSVAGFVLPPLLHIQMHSVGGTPFKKLFCFQRSSLSWFSLVADVLVILFGIAITISGTAFAIADLKKP